MKPRTIAFLALALAGLSATSCKTIDIEQPPAAEPEDGVSVDPSTIPESTLAVSGRITDAQTDQPIAGALVSLEPSGAQIKTNGEGHYAFIAGEATALAVSTLYRITAHDEGYLSNHQQFKLQAGHNQGIDIQLTKGVAQFYLALAPTALTFESGQTEKTVKVRLDTNTADTSQFTTEILDAPWLTVSPDSGTLSAEDRTILVNVDRTQVPEGPSATAEISFSVPGDTRTVSVIVKP